MTLLLAFLLALAESAIGLGAFLPGELAITGIAAGVEGPMQTTGLVLAVTAGAVLGDHVGFSIGRRGGAGLSASRLVQRVGVDRWQRATFLVQRRGMLAVLVSRMLPFVRTVMPAVAGVSGLAYAKFALASVLGSTAWATMWVTAGAAIAATGVLDYLVYVLPAAVAGLLLLLAVRVRSGRLAEHPAPVAEASLPEPVAH